MVANPSLQSLSQEPTSTLYETDYLLWIDATLQQLQTRNFEQLDLDNLIEEISDLGSHHKHAVSSYLMRICEHLLKLIYWEVEREHCYRGWLVEITNFRMSLQKYLKESPSLRRYLVNEFEDAYKGGRKLFLLASAINPKVISKQPIFTLDQALDVDWFPTLPENEPQPDKFHP